MPRLNFITILLANFCWLAATNAGSINKEMGIQTVASPQDNNKGLKDDLKTASSSYSHQYSNWGGNNPGGYGYSVTGFGILDDKIRGNPAYKGVDGYDNLLKSNVYGGYNDLGYNDVGYSTDRYGPRQGYGSIQTGFGSKFGQSGGYNPNGAIGGYAGGYGLNGFSSSGYGGNEYGGSGYGASGYDVGGYGTSGLGANGYAPIVYGASGSIPDKYDGNRLIGNGGYGGYGGNGGLASYSGYNNPLYKGSGHLGYGYYNKGGYGNIYSSGVTPSLITGYRGYTRR